MRKLLLATALIGLVASPALAQTVADTLKAVTTKGVVIKGNAQGMDLEMDITYKADGTYTSNIMGMPFEGSWKIDGDKLCTKSELGESCTTYPAGKKSGDEFEVDHALLGKAKVKIK